MIRNRLEVQVGITVILALVGLIVGMMWFKNVSMSRGVVEYLVDFEAVEGLQERDRVQVRGIRLGQVGGFEMYDDRVRVTLAMDASVRLREDAVISLGTKGIVGEVVIEINPGSGAFVEPGHQFVGHTAAGIAAMTESAGAALDEMRTLTGKITNLVDDIQETGQIVDTLAKANQTLGNLDALVNENRQNLNATLGDLRDASAGLKRIVDSGTIEGTLDSAALAAAQADSLMLVLGESASRLNVLLEKAESGDGTISK